MSMLEIDEDEKLTLKEYVKRKKGQGKFLNKKSKITIIVSLIILILFVYTLVQLYILDKSKKKYSADDSVAAQKSYGIYYLTKGYTYEPKFSLNYINSDGNSDKTVLLNIDFENIYSHNGFVYGTKSDGVYRFNTKTMEIQKIYDKEISNMYVYLNNAYLIRKEDKKLILVNLELNSSKEFDISNVSEVLVDDTYIYVSRLESKKRRIERYDLNGENKVILTKYANVSYMTEYKNNIYFANKDDSGKIYTVTKDGQSERKFSDSKMVIDNGDIEKSCINKHIEVENDTLLYINSGDSNSLWKIDFNTSKEEKIVYSIVEYIQVADQTVFYKTANEASIYLYNYVTSFNSEVVKNKAVKFSLVNEI